MYIFLRTSCTCENLNLKPPRMEVGGYSEFGLTGKLGSCPSSPQHQDCKDSKSAEVRLPDEVQPWLQLIRETEQEEEDEFLLQVSDNLQTEEEEEKILLLASEMF